MSISSSARRRKNQVKPRLRAPAVRSKPVNDPDTKARAAFEALLADPVRFRAIAARAGENGGLNRALAKECRCSKGAIDKYLSQLGLSARSLQFAPIARVSSEDAIYASRVAIWEKLMQALERAEIDVERVADAILDGDDTQKLLRYLADARGMVLTSRPRAIPWH